MRHLSISAMIFVGAILTAGCSAEDTTRPPAEVVLQPVRGKVSVSGKPVTRGRIILFPQDATGRIATGTIQSNGTFTLTTNGKEGAAEGAYRGVLEYAGQAAGSAQRPAKGESAAVGGLPFDPRYTDEDKSDLKITITAGNNDVELKLDPPGKGGA